MNDFPTKYRQILSLMEPKQQPEEIKKKKRIRKPRIKTKDKVRFGEVCLAPPELKKPTKLKVTTAAQRLLNSERDRAILHYRQLKKK